MSKHMAVEIELESGGRLGVVGDEESVRLCVAAEGDVEDMLERAADEDGDACVLLPKMNEAEVLWLSGCFAEWVKG